MAWMKVPEELKEFMDRKTAGFACEKKPMFGCPAYFVNRNMFAGAHEDTVMLRLSEEARREILERYDEVAAFEPMKGRPMREYVALPASVYDGDEFDGWLAKAYQYASSLPPKEKKPKKQRKS